MDELAAIKNRAIYDDMKQSMSAREQPLLFSISTNGFVRESIFDAQYAYAAGVIDGSIEDESFLAWIYELDERDEYRNEKMWIKANPGLGTIKKVDYLRRMVQKADNDPSFLPTVLVKDFNLKENAATSWLTWAECSNPETFRIAFDYGIGGMDAAWMENGTDVLVFGQTADAAYAVRCPIGHKADLEVLLKQTTLIAAPSAE